MPLAGIPRIVVLGVLALGLIGCLPTAAPSATDPAAALPATAPGAATGPTTSPAPSTPTAPTRLTIGHSALSAMWAPLWMAAEAGLLQREDLDATIVNIGSGPVVMAALASGDVQAVYAGGPSIVNGIVAGADVAIVGGYMDRLPYELVARGDIASVRDLRGQTIGVNRIAGATGFVVRLLLEREGLDPERDVSFLQLGAQAERIAALRSGLLGATIVSPPFQTFARQAGLRVLMDTTRLPIDYSACVIAVPRALIEQQPRVVQGLLQATADGLRLFREDRTLALRVLGAHLQVDDPELLLATWEYWRQAFSADLEPRGLEIILQETREEQPSAAAVRVDDLVDFRALRAPRPGG